MLGVRGLSSLKAWLRKVLARPCCDSPRSESRPLDVFHKKGTLVWFGFVSSLDASMFQLHEQWSDRLHSPRQKKIQH